MTNKENQIRALLTEDTFYYPDSTNPDIEVEQYIEDRRITYRKEYFIYVKRFEDDYRTAIDLGFSEVII